MFARTGAGQRTGQRCGSTHGTRRAARIIGQAPVRSELPARGPGGQMAEIVLGLGTSHAPSLHHGPEGWDGGKRDMSNPAGGGMKMDLDIDTMIKERESW